MHNNIAHLLAPLRSRIEFGRKPYAETDKSTHFGHVARIETSILKMWAAHGHKICQVQLGQCAMRSGLRVVLQT